MTNIASIQNQIAELKKQAENLDRANRKAQQEAWQALVAKPENWEWSVKPTSRETFWAAYSTLAPKLGVYVSRRLKPEVLEAWKANGLSTFHVTDMDGNWQGMFYFRTEENILYHDGGGTLVLKDVQLCSDEQWAEMCNGNIPAKFLRSQS